MSSNASSIAFFDDPTMLAPPSVEMIDGPNGSFILRSTLALGASARCIGEWLDHWAQATPDVVFLAERGADDRWRRLSYFEVRRQVGRIAQSLLEMNLPAGKPIVVLSDNAVDHALLLLAGMHIGRPVSTVSSAYSRLAKDASKLTAMLAMLDPGLIYASDAKVYGTPAMAAAPGVPKVFSVHAEQVEGALSFAQLLASEEGPAVDECFRRIQPDDHAKYLLTSGSTGLPKVVINTHRMLCANQTAIAQVWPFLRTEPPIIVDWLPWSHTFGTNHNFNMVLSNGGSLYIDEGRPLPGLIEKSMRNLREIKPNLYFNVPRGFDVMLPILETDAEFAREFFSHLKAMFYAAAALSQATWDRIEAVAERVAHHKVWFTSAWGSTETAPLLTSVHWRLERAGCIGLPVPGVEIKFVPTDGKLEMRVKGVSIFPGYLNEPEMTAKAFDEDGYYKMGDAGLLVLPDFPQAGILFDGRVAEDFKLSSGTWVSVGPMRVRALSLLSPYVQDAVVTGHDRGDVGLMVFLTPQAKAIEPAELAEKLKAGLLLLRQEGGGSAQAPVRLLILDEAPNADAGEITDKGYINQRAVLTRRQSHVEQLYASPRPDHLICIN